MTVGEFIRKHREESGWTQTQLARRTRISGWHQQTVNKIEKGARPLRFAEAVVLADVLGFDLADLAALVPTPGICRNCGGEPPPGGYHLQRVREDLI